MFLSQLRPILGVALEEHVGGTRFGVRRELGTSDLPEEHLDLLLDEVPLDPAGWMQQPPTGQKPWCVLPTDLEFVGRKMEFNVWWLLGTGL